MTRKNQYFSMVAGDDQDLVVTVKNEAGVVVDITGSTIKWAMKKTVNGQAQVSKTTTSGITLTTPSSGVFTISLGSVDTQTLSGRYYHEAELTNNIGKKKTIMTGFANIEPSGV